MTQAESLPDVVVKAPLLVEFLSTVCALISLLVVHNPCVNIKASLHEELLSATWLLTKEPLLLQVNLSLVELQRVHQTKSLPASFFITNIGLFFLVEVPDVFVQVCS